MNEEPMDAAEREERLNEILAEYYQVVEAGQGPDKQEFLARHPDFTAELEEFFADRERFEHLAEPFSPVGDAVRKAQDQVPANPLDTSTIPPGERAAPPPGTTIRYFGDYELLEEIARGGMGVVFRARQVSLNRVVAVKMILAGQLASREDIERFQTEAEAAANLQHPNIVAIHEVGEHQGQHYFSMDYVEGQSLADLVRDNPLPAKKAAGYAKSVAEAIHYAHGQGTLHRDLKPANVLIDASDQPWITDFGLAKRIAADSDLTASGSVVGTASYMPPEQATGKRGEIGPPSDVYSLGATLYELLTGHPPFRAETPLDTLQQVLHSEPVSPRLLNPKVPRDLDTICLKCLEKDQHRRYQSAQMLAEELQQFLSGEPIKARPVGAPMRLWRWCRRKPLVAGLVAAVTVSLLVGTVTSSYFAVQADHRAKDAEASAALQRMARAEAEDARDAARKAQHQAEQQRARAGVLADDLRQQLYAARMELAYHEWEVSNIGHVLEILEGYRPRPGADDLRGFEWFYLWRLCHGERYVFQGHEGPVRQVAFSPDGQTLVTVGRRVTAWDVETNAVLAEYPVDMGEVHCVVFSPDGALLAVGGQTADRRARAVLIDLEEKQIRHRLAGFADVPGAVLALAFSPDGRRLATGTARYQGAGPVPATRLFWIASRGRGNEIAVWDVASGQARSTMPNSTGGVLSLSWSPDGETLIAGCWDRTVRVWNVRQKVLTTTLRTHIGYVWSTAFSPDGETVATGAGKWDGQPEIKLWNVSDWSERMTLRGHGAGVTGVAFSPDGQLLATSSWDRKVKLWNLATGVELRSLNGHRSYVTSVAFSPDGTLLATGGWDHAARLWHACRRLDQTTFVAADVPCYSLAFAPDDKTLAAASPAMKILDLASGEFSGPFSVPGGQEIVAFGPDGKEVATAGMRGMVVIRVAKTGVERLRFKAHRGTVWCIAFSPDGLLLATGGQDNALKLWDVSTGDEVATFVGSGYTIRSLAFSSDASRLAASCHHPPSPPGTSLSDVKVWDVITGELLHVLSPDDAGGHRRLIECVAFSSDGRLLATCSHDRTAKLWDTATWKVRATLQGHLDTIYGLAISPDDRTLATASWDGTVKLWSVAAGRLLATLGGHQGVVFGVAFSHDGKTLAAGSGHIAAGVASIRQLKLWHAATEDEVMKEQ